MPPFGTITRVQIEGGRPRVSCAVSFKANSARFSGLSSSGCVLAASFGCRGLVFGFSGEGLLDIAAGPGMPTRGVMLFELRQRATDRGTRCDPVIRRLGP